MGNCMVQQKKVMIKVVTTDHHEETVEQHSKPAITVHEISDDALPKKTVAPAAGCGGEGAGVLRIKVVITKKELEAILQKGGVTVEDVMFSKLQNLGSKSNHVDRSLRSPCQKKLRPAGVGWVPELESIPEGNL